MIKKLTYQDKALLTPYFDAFNIPVSDLTLTNVMMWKDKYATGYLTLKGFLYLIYTHEDGATSYSQPIGDYDDSLGLLESVKALVKLQIVGGQSLTFRNMDRKTAELIAGNLSHVHMLPSPEHNDYCYLTSELSELKGNRYHKKKNHVNQFIHHYGDSHQIEAITAANALDCLICSQNWCADKNCDGSKDLCFEYLGIQHVLKNWDDYPVEGLLIRHDQIVIGYSFGEMLTDDYFVVHIEKGDTRYQGIYPYLNMLMAGAVSGRFQYVNREQDLGIPGLIKAKKSYHPHHYIEKCELIIQTV